MNIRQVRKKIKSITNVRKITKAMQMVSAIKMKRAQAAAVEERPYQENIDKIIAKISVNLDSKYSTLLSTNNTATQKDLAIVISSNKGLCGSFNFNLFRLMTKSENWKKREYVVIGKKAAMLIPRFGNIVLADFSSNQPQNSIPAVFQMTVEAFLSGKYANVFLLYSRFYSALRIEPVEEKLLPFSYKVQTPIIKERAVEYLIEPSPHKIIDALLRSYLEEKIRNAVIQSEAGEHSARMMAMKNATENANDVIFNLTLLRNKIRQEKITGELLDMITAKESVEVG
ncbi:ATP synthase F1 subunit gamma [Candidatus Roizmanbacteria bacterium CG2_30_33_16]|uniref:ATP synthase gamma chain n=1 Tax=Candidatus Roizmanbacteria bacterium CG2_30_33_16 TaxID=1805340 RepID=A0A1J5I151_9BACT|nr:MAG: ATP synthase F1 subunit gamma [Candidatus Roizmanbacteria bacterium CG2_30_33_16]